MQIFKSASMVLDLGSRAMQPEVEKFNLKLNKKKAASCKLQASSLTMVTG